MSIANDPVYPIFEEWIGNVFSYEGLTKREYFAAMAMQGIISNPNFNNNIQDCAKSSSIAADALIKELEKKS
jgi:hypothetical protein